jgi:hypothetical protein
MNLSKKDLESEIIGAVTSRLSSSYDLSEKAKRRIAKSGSKLADRLTEIFEKQERKAAKKANGSDEDEVSTEVADAAKQEEDL